LIISTRLPPRGYARVWYVLYMTAIRVRQKTKAWQASRSVASVRMPSCRTV